MLAKIFENLKTLIIALLIAILIRSLFFQPFYIPSSSMEPTLLVGDRIFVSKYTYGYSKHSFPFSPKIFNGRLLFKEPKRGDVVVFKTPSDNRTDYIKRLIGLPGDVIQFIDGDGIGIDLWPASQLVFDSAVKKAYNNQRKISYMQFPTDDVIANTTIGDPSAGTGSTPPRDETIAKYGIVKKQIQAYGCTSSGQAYRLAKWTRESEQLLTEIVTFTVSIDTGVIVRPGQVIAINDEVKTGFRRGGRIFNVFAVVTNITSERS